MPFIGKRGTGEVVIPSEVPDDAIVECPGCGGKMRVQSSFFNQGKFISRHFRHRKSGSECSGGESKTHQKMKAIAASKMDTVYSGGEVIVEKQIAPGRIADVVYEFDTPNPPYGEGFACLFKLKNDSKRTGQVTREYLAADYSIIWAYESDFDFGKRDFELPDHRMIEVWPNAIPEPKGRDLYPENTPTRLKDEARNGDGPGKVPARFPPIVLTVHQFDINSPVHGETPPDWDEFDYRDLHGVGRHRTKLTIYGHRALGSFLEVRTIDRKTSEEEFIPVPISPDDAAPIEEFCRVGENTIAEYDGETPDNWRTECMVELSYNAGLRGRLFFGLTEDGEHQFVFNQYDIFGVLRTHRIDYRPGDFDRLSEIVEVVENVHRSKYPLKKGAQQSI
jgi:hypothetical protein